MKAQTFIILLFQLQLLWIIFSLVSSSAGHDGKRKICTASNQPGAQNFVSCTVLYTDSVTLECPPQVSNSSASRPSWGRIVRGNKVGISQCYDNVSSCSIIGGVISEAGGRHLFGLDDSGLYFCRDFGTENAYEYYLNLTIVVPPQILGNSLYCKSYHLCEQPHPPVDPNDSRDFSITVEYYGSNVSVDWRHNGALVDCQEPMCERTNTSSGLYHKTTLTLKVSHAGRYKDFVGTYTANLSNAYGWNVSSVVINCIGGLTPPTDVVSNTTQNLTAGSKNLQISCSVEYGNSADIHIGMCYAPNGESYRDLNVTENCLFCSEEEDDSRCTLFNGDGTIQPRPDWRVSVRDKTVLDCFVRRTTILQIPKVTMADNNGAVYCVWQDLLTPNVYEAHNLRVSDPAPKWIQVNWKYVVLGGGLLTVCVLSVVLLLVTALLRSWKKVRRAERSKRRRQERRENIQDRRTLRSALGSKRPAAPAGSDASDTDEICEPSSSQSSQSSAHTSCQSSGQVTLEANLQHVQSPLLGGGIGRHSIQRYGTTTVEQLPSWHQEPGNYTDAPLLCTTADEEAYDWMLPGAHKALKNSV